MTSPSPFEHPRRGHDPSVGDHVEGLATPRQGRGCLFWGCISILVVVLLAGGLAGAWVCKFYGFLNDISEDAPRDDLAVPAPTPEELAVLEQRFEAFEGAAAADGDAELVLDADDINARLLASNPELQGMVKVSIAGERLLVDASVPLEGIGLGGRYVNGTIEAGLEMRDGRVEVRLESVRTTKGDEIPKDVLDEMSRHVSEDPDTRKRVLEDIFGNAARHAKSLEVKDGRLVFRR